MNENNISAEKQQISETIRQIRRLIAGSMDGVTAEKMRNNGLGYKQNFGVAFPRLKEIAKEFPQNKEIAEQLWQIGGRETMIVATLLLPSDTTDVALRWANELPTNEISEIIAMTLFQRIDNIDDVLLKILSSQNRYALLTACCTATRTCKNLKSDTLEKIIATITKSETDLATANATYNLLITISDIYPEILPQLLQPLQNAQNPFLQQVYNNLTEK